MNINLTANTSIKQTIGQSGRIQNTAQHTERIELKNIDYGDGKTSGKGNISDNIYIYSRNGKILRIDNVFTLFVQTQDTSGALNDMKPGVYKKTFTYNPETKNITCDAYAIIFNGENGASAIDKKSIKLIPADINHFINSLDEASKKCENLELKEQLADELKQIRLKYAKLQMFENPGT